MSKVKLTEDQKRIYKQRAKLVLDNLKNCNSGADVHEVGNMRNVATLFMELMDCDTGTNPQAIETLERLEKQQLEFFRKKFSYLK